MLDKAITPFRQRLSLDATLNKRDRSDAKVYSPDLLINPNQAHEALRRKSTPRVI